ncbi:hydrogenase formation protein HypD [Vibrio mediterranei]
MVAQPSVSEIYQVFRQSELVKALADKIAVQVKALSQPLYIMEVCGGHTHTIMKYGLKQLLPQGWLHFVHGPGCPVCIMPKERIDHAIALAHMPEVILVTLGDMIRVPGSTMSLAQCRAQGGQVEHIYDPIDVLKIAENNSDKTVIYFAIGFETTTPMTAVLVQQAKQRQLSNLYLHINHVLVPPAMHAVLADDKTPVNAFIGPSHVSVITGAKIYQSVIDRHQVPVVVAGFEPVDVLASVLQLVELAVAKQAELTVQYSRAVSYDGNVTAQNLVNQVFETRESFNWRGLGAIPQSALKLREEYAAMDAELVFADRLPHQEIADHKACLCGYILRGLATPPECKAFGRACKPQRPIGSCMVSSEGACNAYYRYASIM